MVRVLETLLLLRCRHRRFSRPVSRTGAKPADRIMYVVCLDCGTEFEYDWDHMKIVKQNPSKRAKL